MEAGPAAVEAQGDGVGRPPLIERTGVEEAEERVAAPLGDVELPGSAQAVLKRQARQDLDAVRSVGRAENGGRRAVVIRRLKEDQIAESRAALRSKTLAE